jgi:hypothetical protein
MRPTVRSGRVLALDRSRVRRRFDERFSVSRMAQDYLRIYERQIGTAGKGAEETATPAHSAEDQWRRRD